MYVLLLFFLYTKLFITYILMLPIIILITINFILIELIKYIIYML